MDNSSTHVPQCASGCLRLGCSDSGTDGPAPRPVRRTGVRRGVPCEPECGAGDRGSGAGDRDGDLGDRAPVVADPVGGLADEGPPLAVEVGLGDGAGENVVVVVGGSANDRVDLQEAADEGIVGPGFIRTSSSESACSYGRWCRPSQPLSLWPGWLSGTAPGSTAPAGCERPAVRGVRPQAADLLAVVVAGARCCHARRAGPMSAPRRRLHRERCTASRRAASACALAGACRWSR